MSHISPESPITPVTLQCASIRKSVSQSQKFHFNRGLNRVENRSRRRHVRVRECACACGQIKKNRVEKSQSHHHDAHSQLTVNEVVSKATRWRTHPCTASGKHAAIAKTAVTTPRHCESCTHAIFGSMWTVDRRDGRAYE